MSLVVAGILLASGPLANAGGAGLGVLDGDLGHRSGWHVVMASGQGEHTYRTHPEPPCSSRPGGAALTLSLDDVTGMGVLSILSPCGQGLNTVDFAANSCMYNGSGRGTVVSCHTDRGCLGVALTDPGYTGPCPGARSLEIEADGTATYTQLAYYYHSGTGFPYTAHEFTGTVAIAVLP